MKKKKASFTKMNIINGIIVILMTFAIMYVIYTTIKLIIEPAEIVMIEKGTIASEESTIGYVIREETVVQGDANGNEMVQMKMEGEKVAKGDIVFRYKSNSENSINNKIEELNDKIQEALEGKTDMFLSDIKAIDVQIENKIDGLKVRNNIQEIAEYKKDIDKYITKKAKIAGDLSPAGEYINGLIEEKVKYQNEINLGSEYVTSPGGGVVSYRVDNYEEVLNIQNLNSIDKATLSSLDIKTGQIVTSSNKMGKVINNFKCYIVTPVKSNEAKEAKVGNKVKIRLASQDEVMATIEDIKESGDGELLMILKITDCVEKLIDYRKISIDIIWWEHSGLKVPNNAIVYLNGLSYVVRNRSGYLDTILVEILKTNQSYSIVTNYDTEELKELGYTMSEINTLKKISIYDEVVLTPDIENVK